MIFILVKAVKRKCFIFLKLNSFLKKIMKIIKNFVFQFLKINFKKKKIENIINKMKKTIYKLYSKNQFNKIKLFAYNKKNYSFLIKIKFIYIKNNFDFFIYKYREKKDKNIKKENINCDNSEEVRKEESNIKKNLLNKEKIKNKTEIDNNNDINNIYYNKSTNNENIKIIIGNDNEIPFLIEENNNSKKNGNLFGIKKYDQENIMLNNAFFHNKEIFQNLRYDDELFAEDLKKDDIAFNEDKINNNLEINVQKNYLNKLPNNIKAKLEKELTEEIIKEIIDNEINNKNKIINKKKPINEFNYNQKDKIFGVDNISSNNNNSQLNSSLEYSVNTSILNKTIGEIKEGRKLNQYRRKKFPIFLKMIEKYLIINYNEIINNLEQPLIIDEEKYLNQLNEVLLNRHKNINNNLELDFNNENENNEQRKSFLNKFNIPYFNKDLIKKKFVDEKILKEFNIKNKLMNQKSNEETINSSQYDIILNKCVYDSANEIIEKRRKYGSFGKPLLWSHRNIIIKYKYDKSKYSKKIFIKEILTELKDLINKKIGLIPENYDYMSLENLISDREKKFNKNIHDDLIENEEKENNLDLIISLSLMNISKIIMDQLLEEVIQILNLVEKSRKEPTKFGAKSIYSFEYEDIPIFSLDEKNDFEEDNFIL